MSKMQDWIQTGQSVLIGNYARQPIVMERGEGSLLWDADGKRYIDVFAGFGGAILGHCHPALVAAAERQARTLWHVGNTFYGEPQIAYANRMSQVVFPGKGFFCHSGAEANEAACKLARLRGNTACAEKNRIIALNHSFHGRTMAMLAATGTAKYRAGFEPHMPGFVHVQGGDFAALESAVDEKTAGIIMEPIQGEGGMNIFPEDYYVRVRQLCDARQITLIFDEVWTGCGRTGKWFAHQHLDGGKGVVPDILTLGKAVGGGLPVGVMWARPELAALLVPGTHGCTLGGNGICMAVAKAVLDTIEKESLLAHASALGEAAMARLRNERRISDKVAAVRGRGLMLGIELKQAPEKFVEKGLERGIILNLTAGKVVRLAPAINIPRELWDQALDMVIDLLADL